MSFSFSYDWGRKSSKEKQQMADACKTTKDYLSKIAHGHREPSRALFARMQKFDDSIERSTLWL